MNDFKHLSRRATDRPADKIFTKDQIKGLVACILLTVIGTIVFLVTLADSI